MNARDLPSPVKQSATYVLAAAAKIALIILMTFHLAGPGRAAAAMLKAGVARVSINPMEEKIPTPLGGYGERDGKPAVGTLDTIYGKVILFE